MTIAINGSGTITGISVGGLNDNIITKNEMATGSAWAPAGTVVQVVQATTSTAVQNATTSYIDSGLSATITPTSATSKILVMLSQNIYKASSNAGNQVFMQLLNGASVISVFGKSLLYTGTTVELYGNIAYNYLDSPATTSPVTYKTQFKNGVAVSYVACQSDSVPLSTMILMEIAA